jgi:hypothetical protein
VVRAAGGGDGMTKKEQQAMDRLKLENEHLREYIEKHMAVYREQLYELVELKTQIDLIKSAMEGEE